MTEPKQIDIVIVDDSEDLLKVLKMILNRNGYKIRSYADAEEVLRDVPDFFVPDLFLLDVTLPGMNGFQLCRKLKDSPVLSQVPVIFISGLMDDMDKLEGFKAGGEDYITKPFSQTDLLARVKTHIKLRKSLLQLTLFNQELESRIDARTRELQKAKEEAEEANRAKSTFMFNINHEIRNPLNGVLGMLNLMKGTSLDSEGELYLSLAEYSANNLSVIIRDILDFSQLETRTITLEYKEFDVSSMIQKLILIQAAKAEEKGLLLKLKHSSEKKYFTGDEIRLFQILTNLVSNAVKFSYKGTITVSYSIDNALLLEVCDQGIGIPPDRIEDIFLPFFQIDTGLTKENKGVGLGLSIVKQLVSVMGGDIELFSNRKGTCFRIVIPSP